MKLFLQFQCLTDIVSLRLFADAVLPVLGIGVPATVAAVAVDLLLAAIVVSRQSLVVILVVEIERRQARQAFPEVFLEAEIFSSVVVRTRLVAARILDGLVRARFRFHRCGRSSAHPAETALRYAPRSSQHLHPLAERLGQAGFSRRRWHRPRRRFLTYLVDPAL